MTKGQKCTPFREMISVVENCKQSQNRVQITRGKIGIFNKIRIQNLYDEDTKNKLTSLKQK